MRLKCVPETTVQWFDGKIAINVNGANGTQVFEDPAVLQLLHAFSVPSDDRQVAKAIGNGSSASVLELIGELQGKGVLVPAHFSHREVYPRWLAKKNGMDIVHSYDDDMTITNCAKEDLSPGCQSCKSGGWICAFPSFSCNARCTFCPRLTRENIEKLMTPTQVDLLFAALHANADKVSGLAISGGDLFFNSFETGLVIAERARRELPHLYLWGYTNGIGATRDKLRAARDAGLEEVRFNLAATDFDPAIIKKVEDWALKIFPWVTVEVPCFERSYSQLVEHGKLRQLAEMGVRQLNLTEIRVPLPDSDDPRDTSPAARDFFGKRDLYAYTSPLDDTAYYALVESRFLTLDVMQYAHDEGIDIRINDCSQDAKILQSMGRTAKQIEYIQLQFTNRMVENLRL